MAGRPRVRPLARARQSLRRLRPSRGGRRAISARPQAGSQGVGWGGWARSSPVLTEGHRAPSPTAYGGGGGARGSQLGGAVVQMSPGGRDAADLDQQTRRRPTKKALLGITNSREKGHFVANYSDPPHSPPLPLGMFTSGLFLVQQCAPSQPRRPRLEG